MIDNAPEVGILAASVAYILKTCFDFVRTMRADREPTPSPGVTVTAEGLQLVLVRLERIETKLEHVASLDERVRSLEMLCAALRERIDD